MSAARLLCRSILAPEHRVDKDAQARPPQRGRWHPHSGVRRRGRRRSRGRLWQGDPLEYLPDKNMSLRRRQVVRNEASVNSQTEHRPGVAGRFEFNCDLSDHRPLPAEIRYRIADHPHLVYAPLDLGREVLASRRAPLPRHPDGNCVEKNYSARGLVTRTRPNGEARPYSPAVARFSASFPASSIAATKAGRAKNPGATYLSTTRRPPRRRAP